jgi:hypothetical protein
MKDMSGGGPAGVVEGALKLRLERRESGVEGGEEDGTRNMTAIMLRFVVGHAKARTEDRKRQEQLGQSRVGAPVFSRCALRLEAAGDEMRFESRNQQTQNFTNSSFTTRHKIAWHAAEQPPGHLRKNHFPRARMLMSHVTGVRSLRHILLCMPRR